MGRPAVAAIDRFEAKYDLAANGCWKWTAGTYTDRGYLYGQFFDGTNRVRAHRFIWEYQFEIIPIDRQLYRTCETVLCVRPAHHELGPVNRRCATATHCPAGHEYAGDNLAISIRGGRVCRTCTAAGQRRYEARPIPRVMRRIGRIRRMLALAGHPV